MKSPSEIPDREHYTALIFTAKQIRHEGDERSRTNPGHGYPAYTETIHNIEYKIFSDKLAMERWVGAEELKGADRKAKYRIILAKPLTVSIQVTANVS